MDSDLLAPHDLAPIVTFRDRFIDSELRSLVFEKPRPRENPPPSNRLGITPEHAIEPERWRFLDGKDRRWLACARSIHASLVSCYFGRLELQHEPER